MILTQRLIHCPRRDITSPQILFVLRHQRATSSGSVPSSRPPEGGAQLAFGRTDLSASQRSLHAGGKSLVDCQKNISVNFIHVYFCCFISVFSFLGTLFDKQPSCESTYLQKLFEPDDWAHLSSVGHRFYSGDVKEKRLTNRFFSSMCEIDSTHTGAQSHRARTWGSIHLSAAGWASRTDPDTVSSEHDHKPKASETQNTEESQTLKDPYSIPLIFIPACSRPDERMKLLIKKQCQKKKSHDKQKSNYLLKKKEISANHKQIEVREITKS